MLVVVGVGLIGGSIIRAVRARNNGARVVGVDPQWQAASEAVDAEVVDAGDAAGVAAALAQAKLVVLATPVHVIRGELTRALDSGAIVTDCGSTKREIAQAAAAHPNSRRFVPGHPMAGFPEGGVQHADPNLFQDRRWILCPEFSAADAVTEVEALVRSVGAQLVRMNAADHDRAVALTSHVPQLLASVLRATAAEIGADAAAGPGFASATRVAGGSANIWADIFSSNADQIRWALKQVISELERVSGGLGADPVSTEAAMDLLARARQARDRS